MDAETKPTICSPRFPAWALFAVVLAGAVLGGPASLAAQEQNGSAESKEAEKSESEEAKTEELTEAEQKRFDELVAKGKKEFSEENYEAALENFDKAYALKASPNLLFNMGLVAERAGDLEEALEHYEEFVVSPGISLDLREKAQNRIDTLRPIVEDQKKAKEDDESEAAPEELAESEETTDDGEKEDATDTGDSSGGGISKGGAFAMIGGGVLLAGGGVVFTLLSESVKQKFPTGESPAKRRDLQKRAVQHQWIANGMFVGALGLGTVGAVLLANTGGGSGGDASAAVVPTIGPNIAGIRLQTRF